MAKKSKRRNLVQKHALRFQKAGPMKDKKKAAKRGERKHKRNLAKAHRHDGPFSLEHGRADVVYLELYEPVNPKHGGQCREEQHMMELVW